MKEFLKWFKSGAKIKRWLVLMLLGIVFACYGVSKVLIMQELSFIELAKIVIAFAIGFTFVVVSMVCMQKRTLEILVQESDTRNIEKKDNVNSLIFNKRVYNQGPKVVVIGGGSGLNTVLRGLKNYTDNITAIVTVSDYGTNQSSPLNDIKSSLIALANDENKMAKLLNAKIENNKGEIEEFSNIYFYAMQEIYGDFTKSIEESKDLLNITGKVLPVTLDNLTICAELEDGTIVESKERIPEVVNEKISKINRVYISPTNCRVAPGVIDAISEADAIVIGPGSLYTNVIPNLLVPRVSRAIRESKAFKVYVSNIMTEAGQTDDYSLATHIKAIVDHAGKGIIDYCIYDTGEIIPEYIKKYNKEGCELVEQDTSKVKNMGIKLIQRDLSTIEDEAIRHNSDAIATSIIQLICEDLKFNDMQNDAQFLMLNSKIKGTKTKLKEEAKNKKYVSKNKNKRDSKKKASKFYEKYNDRIESIKDSERKQTKGVNKKKAKSKSEKNDKKDTKNSKEEIKDINNNKDVLEIINKMRK